VRLMMVRILLVTIGFGRDRVLADDYAKVQQSPQTTAGVSRPDAGLCWALFIAGSAAYGRPQFHPRRTADIPAGPFPYLKNTLDQPWLSFLPFSIIVIVGAANAVTPDGRGLTGVGDSCR